MLALMGLAWPLLLELENEHHEKGVGFRDTQAALGVSGDSKDVKDPKRPR